MTFDYNQLTLHRNHIREGRRKNKRENSVLDLRIQLVIQSVLEEEAVMQDLFVVSLDLEINRLVETLSVITTASRAM